MDISITNKKSNLSNNEDLYIFINNKHKFPIIILHIIIFSFNENNEEKYKNIATVKVGDNAIVKIDKSNNQFIYIYSKDLNNLIMKIKHCQLLKLGTSIDVY